MLWLETAHRPLTLICLMTSIRCVCNVLAAFDGVTGTSLDKWMCIWGCDIKMDCFDARIWEDGVCRHTLHQQCFPCFFFCPIASVTGFDCLLDLLDVQQPPDAIWLTFLNVSVTADRQYPLPEKDQMRKLNMQHHSSEFLNVSSEPYHKNISEDKVLQQPDCFCNVSIFQPHFCIQYDNYLHNRKMISIFPFIELTFCSNTYTFFSSKFCRWCQNFNFRIYSFDWKIHKVIF